MIIIIIITLIRKFLKQVDNLTSSAGIAARFWSHTGARPTGQQPYAELEFTGVVKCYIYAEYHECINEKYLNIKIAVSSFFYIHYPTLLACSF